MDQIRSDKPEGAPACAQNADAGAPSGGAGPERRNSARRKLAAVTRLLRGEPLETVARELNVTVARLSEWRDRALVAAEAAMKERERDSRDEEVLRLKAKLGEVTMTNELLEQKIAALEGGRPLGRRRSRRGAGPSLRPRATPTAWPGLPGSGGSPAPRSTAIARRPTPRHRPVRHAGARSVPALMPRCSSTFAPRSSAHACMARATARSGPGCAMAASAPRPGGSGA